MTMTKRTCGNCRQKAVEPTTLAAYSAELEYAGTAYTVTVPDLAALQCGICGNVVLQAPALARVTAALRKAAGLLSPEEIVRERELLGLTQEQLAKRLTVARETLSRWECGSQLPQPGYNLLLRLYFGLYPVRRFIENRNRPRPLATTASTGVKYMDHSETLWSEIREPEIVET